MTDAEVQTDLELDWSERMKWSTNEIIQQLTIGESMTGPSIEKFPLLGTKTARQKKKPVVISVEKLKEPYFDPSLRGVWKHLNPLSNAADVRVAPALHTPCPSALY